MNDLSGSPFNLKAAIGSGGMGILPMGLSFLDMHRFVRAIFTGWKPVPLNPPIAVFGFKPDGTAAVAPTKPVQDSGL